MAHVANWKKDELQLLKSFISDNSVVGIVSIDGIPSRQMAEMRNNLKGKVSLRVAKNTLISIALTESEESKKDIGQLNKVLVGKQCALVSGNLNAFKLYKEMESTITPSPARGGDLAAEDIVIEKGETSFKPGPIVGDFGKAGIPAAIEKGKVVIKKTSTVCKAGEPIKPELAMMLTKLEIFPMKVGLNLISVYEDGTVFEPSSLAIDEDKVKGEFALGAGHALNLAMFAAITTPATIKPLIQKAFGAALNLAVNAAVTTKDSMPMIIAKAYMNMLAIASNAEEGLDDDLRSLLSNAPAAAAPSAEPPTESEDSKEPEEEEEEEVTEEDAMAGLGALFG